MPSPRRFASLFLFTVLTLLVASCGRPDPLSEVPTKRLTFQVYSGSIGGPADDFIGSTFVVDPPSLGCQDNPVDCFAYPGGFDDCHRERAAPAASYVCYSQLPKGTTVTITALGGRPLHWATECEGSPSRSCSFELDYAKDVLLYFWD